MDELNTHNYLPDYHSLKHPPPGLVTQYLNELKNIGLKALPRLYLEPRYFYSLPPESNSFVIIARDYAIVYDSKSLEPIRYFQIEMDIRFFLMTNIFMYINYYNTNRWLVYDYYGNISYPIITDHRLPEPASST